MGEIFRTGKYECNKCGNKFLAQEPHPCPKCQKEEFEQWKQKEE